MEGIIINYYSIKMTQLENKFHLVWISLKGQKLVKEYRFHHKRRFRFDFAHLETKTAIELEGGCWVHGAHNRGAHFNSDCEKYNLANLLGWRVFRLTTNMIKLDHIKPIIDFIKT